MSFTWHDYNPQTMGYIDTWLDESAVKSTGLDEGFRHFYEYWANEDGFTVGKNFWCKVVFEDDNPVAVVALCEYEGNVTIMEMVVVPEKRGRGIGTKLLKELLGREEIIGYAIQKSDAVIFLSNLASQKAFANAGFRYHHTHEDGDALCYTYQIDSKP